MERLPDQLVGEVRAVGVAAVEVVDIERHRAAQEGGEAFLSRHVAQGSHPSPCSIRASTAAWLAHAPSERRPARSANGHRRTEGLLATS